MEKTLDLIIRDAQAAQSVGDIRKQLKALTNEMLKVGEGSAEFNKLAAAAGDLKEKMNEAKETIAAFNPDALEAVGNFAGKAAAGVSLVTGAMGLFGEQSKDVEKALMKVQAAMAFAQGIQGIKGITKAFQNLFAVIAANPIAAIAVGLAALATAAYKIYQAYQDANSEVAKANRLYEKQKEVTAALSREYDREIELLTAQGASEEQIIAVKKQKIAVQLLEAEAAARAHLQKVIEIQDNDSLYESYLRVNEQILRAAGLTEQADKIAAQIQLNKQERAKEDSDAFNEQIEQIKDLRNQLTILGIEEEKAAEESGKKWKDANDKKAQDAIDAMQREDAALEAIHQRQLKRMEEIDKKDEEDHLKWKARRHSDRLAQLEIDELMATDDLAKMNAHLALLEFQKNEELKNKELTENQKKLIVFKYNQEVNSIIKAFNDKKAAQDKAREQMIADFRINAIKSVLSIAGELFKDNAEAQKAIGAAVTLVDTYVAAQKAFASQITPGDPTSLVRGYIAAGLAVVAGLARVAAILRVDTENPSASGAGAGGNTGTLATSTQPNINASAQPTTFINQTTNNQSTPNVWVSVAEIREVDDVVQAAELRSRF